MSEAQRDSAGLSPDARARQEQLIGRFESAWQRGECPRVEAYLPANAAERQAVLVELIHAELECRLKTGQAVRVEEFLQRFPELSAERSAVLELLTAEYELRRRQEPGLTRAEYERRFPQYHAELATVESVWLERRPFAGQPLSKGRIAVPVESTAALMEALRQYHLLEVTQLKDLDHLQEPFNDARALAKELLRRGWLTAYQVNQLLQGKGAELVMGPYLLLERLGEGGMGTVFKARQRKLKRLAALKIIRKEHLAAPNAVHRFQREAEAAARLAHPNIVTVYDADEAGGTHFLAMEYIEGTDLAHLVKQSGPLPVEQACEYIRQAALGLQHAHEHGLVHRDIKPANLVLAHRVSSLAGPTTPGASKAAGPTNAVVKILDMGLARLDHAEGADDVSGTLTQEGMVMGSLDFLAPEQAQDSHRVDIRADLYSLGCTFYFLLTGQVPFPSGAATTKLLKHRLDEPEPVEQLRPGLPAELAAAVKKLMAKRPEDRYQTPVEVAEALADLMSTANGPAPSLGLGQQRAEEKPLPERNASEALTAAMSGLPDLARPVARSNDTPSDLAAPDAAAKVGAAGAPRGTISAARMKHGLALAGSLLLLIGGGLSVLLFLHSPRKLVTGGADPGNPKPPIAIVERPPQEKPWKSGPADNVLRGLVPRPATLPGIKRWQVETVLPHSAVNTVAWSADSRLLACGTETGEVRVYDAQTLQLVQLLIGHSNRVNSIAWSPDGKRLASGGFDYTVRLWEADGTPGLVLKLPNASLCVAWSPDGKRLASTVSDVVFLWEADGTPGPVLKGHEGGVLTVAFSPDGKQLVSGSEDRTIRLWGADGKPGAVLKGNTDRVMSLAWSPDSKRLASTNGTMVRLWDADGAPGSVLKGHIQILSSVAWSADGKRLASAGYDQTVRLWQEDGKPSSVLKGHTHDVLAIAWSPDGKRLASADGGGNVWLWEADGHKGPILKGHMNRSLSAKWSPDGKQLASASLDTSLRLWQADGQQGPILKGCMNRGHSVPWSADGKRLALANDDGTVRIWQVDGREGAVLKGHTGPVESVDWSPDGSGLASGSWDQTVRLWQVDGTPGPILKGHTGWVLAVAWNPDSKCLASGGDQTVRLWQADGKEGPILKGHTGFVLSVAWSPDGKHLASAGFDSTVRLWQADGTPGLVLKGHTQRFVDAVVWSPDGKRLASGSGDQTVRLWQANGTPGPVLTGHTGSVNSVSWSAGGRIASCGEDSTIRLWDATSAEPQAVIVPLPNAQSVTFSAAGQLRHGDAATVENEFVYIVEQPGGRLEVLKPSAFHARLAAGK